MANLILFGAGASYGSDTVGTPPLGGQLFDELQRFNPDAWGTISGDLATEFRADFEQAMKLVAPHALAPLQRAMAAFFFRYQPAASNRYVQLVRRMKAAHWSGAVCTLNYERLLELSVGLNGMQPVVGQPSDPGRSLELCMPHGCCHLFCDSVRASAGAVSFDAFAISTDGPVKAVVDPAEHRQRILQEAFPPVMSYFEPQKRVTSGRSFLEGQRARWKELALVAESIAVVGVKVRPHDGHIWAPLGEAQARIIYCGGPRAAEDFRTWAMTQKRSQDVILEGYFGGEFDRISSEIGL